MKSPYADQVVLLTTTFSPSVEDMRAQLALKTCKKAHERGFPIIVVDGSPCQEFKRALRDTGAIVVDQQEFGMEGSRRQVFRLGLERFPGVKVYGWLEPEKHPMVDLLDPCFRPIIEPENGPVDVVVPRRKTLTNYPLYQQWSELTANWQLGDITGRYKLDLYSGPRFMSRRATQRMADFNSGGDGKWKIIFLPLVWMMFSGWCIVSVTVDYIHPAEQLVEDNESMRAKRDEQRTALVQAMSAEWKHQFEFHNMP